MWVELLTALALVLVIEGMMPFVAPERWRKLMLLLVQQEGRSLRLMGLFSMLAGVVLLSVVRY